MDTTLPESRTQTQPGLSTEAIRALSPRFELLRELGRGAMGVVYQARQRSLDRLVALKVMLPGASTDRFLREARLLGQVHSPHVVTVHDCEILADLQPMLVMEWVEGETLAETMRRVAGPLPEEDVLPWMRQTAEGMAAAAELGIIHRDLKPSNLLIADCGLRNADSGQSTIRNPQSTICKVADFGLACAPEAAPHLTLPDQGMMGTPYYMAPEQAENPRGVDTRADVYAFGATFYHALTGQTPFDGETVFTVLFRHKTEPLIPPRARNPLLSEHLSEIVERCLAKSPNDRFSSFRDLSRQLSPGSFGLSPWLDASDERLTAYLKRYQERRSVYLDSAQQLAEPERYEFPNGRVLNVLTGSMVEQHVDALVSSDDGHLTMGTTLPNPRGVAAALRLAAGPDYVADVRRFVPVRPGRVAVTGAGQLPARFVFHGITLEGPVEQRVCPSRDLIAEILTACFYHADSLEVRTMAFPLLGTGTGGFSAEVCLDTMFRYLARMLLRGVTSVREVRLVLYRS